MAERACEKCGYVLQPFDRICPKCRGQGFAAPVQTLRTSIPGAREAIRFSCPGCGKELAVSVEYAAKQGKCAHCGAVVTVPEVPSELPEFGATDGLAPSAPPEQVSPGGETVKLWAGAKKQYHLSPKATAVTASVLAGLLTILFAYVALLNAKEPKPSRGASVAFTVSAPGLIAEYQANTVAADAKYKGKGLYVTGVVASIGEGALDTGPFVALYGTDEWGVNTVQCCFSAKDRPRLANLAKGQTVTITGECSGMEMTSVMLTRCSL